MKVCLYLCILLYIISVSCGVSSQVKYTNWNKLIEGEWKLVELDQVNYPTIEFNKKQGATFNSADDTIYYYSYKLKKDDLILNDGTNADEHAKILKLTRDSLIFETLLLKTYLQRYVRLNDK